jgi:AhpD family alkylhydroperoxidase
MARISLVDPATAPEDVRPLLEQVQRDRGGVFNVYRTLAHSPASLAAMLQLARALWSESALDPKLQELIILRVAQLTGSDYEWGRHRILARRFGVPDEVVASLAQWKSAPVFSPAERAALAVTDEASRQIEASGGAIAELRRHFSERQTVEIALLGGMYQMVARLLRSLDVDQEPGDELVPAAADV